MSTQERVLDHIERIDFTLQAPADLQPHEQCQVVPVQFKELPQGGTAPRPHQA
jgi:hypothetical protein